MEKRIIGIVSGKGGVGKTTVTINLASALLSFGRNALVVDADLKMCGASLQLGMYNYPITLNEVLNESMSIYDAIYTHRSGLKVIPASFFSEPASYLSLRKAFSDLELENVILLVDSPPGVEENAIEVIKLCKEIIPVVTPDLPSVADTIKVVDLAKDNGISPLGVIVNRYSNRIKNQTSLNEIKEAFEAPILGVIYEDELIRKSINERVPAFYLNPNSKNSLTFKEIAAKIIGIDFKPKVSILGKLFPFFR
jgi:cell division ATPase MinD